MLFPVEMRYGVSEDVPRGQVIHIAATAYAPECWVFHSDQDARVFGYQSGCRMVKVGPPPPKDNEEDNA